MEETRTRSCPGCRRRVTAGTNFCQHCGARLPQDAAATQPQPPAAAPAATPARPRGRNTDLTSAAERRKFLKRFAIAAVMLAAIGALSSRQPDSSDPAPGRDFSAVTDAAPADSDAESVADGRCEDVPYQVVGWLEQGLSLPGGVRDAQAVRSEDFSKVWFISADIQGEGIDGDGPIGTWTTTSIDPSEPRGFASVDDTALQFSNWANGPRTQANLSMSDDGAQESVECSRAAAQE